jgi:hypothetical protein
MHKRAASRQHVRLAFRSKNPSIKIDIAETLAEHRTVVLSIDLLKRPPAAPWQRQAAAGQTPNYGEVAAGYGALERSAQQERRCNTQPTLRCRSRCETGRGGGSNPVLFFGWTREPGAGTLV